METGLLLIQILPEALLALATVISAGVAAYKAIKAKNYKRGLDLTKETLDGVIVGIELAPNSPDTKRVKEAIRQVADYLGTNSTVLADRVKKFEALLAELGIQSSGTEPGDVIRGAEAARRWRKEND